MSFTSQVNTFLTGASKVVSDASSLKKSYNQLRSGISSSTLGLVNLPQLPSSLNRIFKAGQSVNTILQVLGLTGDGVAGNASHTQVSSNGVETGSFKWVEMETTPDSFATADSMLLFAGDPIYANLDIGAELVPIGLCQQFSFSSGVNVSTFKELRCEETIVIPGKSLAGSMTISRLCGDYSSLSNRLHISPNWNFSTQSTLYKPLFGLMAMFLNPSRNQTVSTLYFERSAISSFNVGVSAGNFQILDNLNIVYGRCIGVGEISSNVESSGTTENTRTQDAAQNSPTGKETITVGGNTIDKDLVIVS